MYLGERGYMNRFKLRLEGWNKDKQCLAIVTKGVTPEECIEKMKEWVKRDPDKWWLDSKRKSMNANKKRGEQLELELR